MKDKPTPNAVLAGKVVGVLLTVAYAFVPVHYRIVALPLLGLSFVVLWIVGRMDVDERGPRRRRVEFDNSPPSGVRETVTIDGIISARPIDGLEDFGPGYVVTTRDGQTFLLMAECLAEIDHEGEALREKILVTIDTGSHEIVNVEASGTAVSVSIDEFVSIMDIAATPLRSFMELPASS